MTSRNMRKYSDWVSAVLLCIALLLSSDKTFAQQPGRGEFGDNGTTTPQTAQAIQGIDNIKNTMLKDYVSQAIPLKPEDVETIKTELKKIIPYQGLLDKTNKAYISMIEAYLAFYSGQIDDCLEKARKATQLDEDNPDVNDTLVILGLCSENYNLVKPLLKKRNSGEDVTLPPLTEQLGAPPTRTPGQKSGLPGIGTAARSDQPEKTSKWSVAPPPENTMRGERGEFSAVTPQPGIKRPGYAMGPGQQAGILNLPVKCMPSENLGEDFASLNLRIPNGAYFHFASGKGQILCVLMWTLPYKPDGKDGADSARMKGERTERPASAQYRSGQENPSNIPPVAFDLPTNLEQYRQLMLQTEMSGRIFFVTANMDAHNQYSWQRVLSTFAQEPWPWVNCMVNDPFNAPRWPIKQRYSPIMAIVDTTGKIRYLGPVGGFLPRMLLSMEYMRATPLAATEIPVFSSQAQQPAASGASPGKAANSADPSSADAGQPGAASLPQAKAGKTSDPQAKSMIQVAHLKKKISPTSALQQCDDIIERFPDSIEADEAKLIIKSVLSTRSELVDQRKKQGKYTGE